MVMAPAWLDSPARASSATSAAPAASGPRILDGQGARLAGFACARRDRHEHGAGGSGPQILDGHGARLVRFACARRDRHEHGAGGQRPARQGVAERDSTHVIREA